MIDDFEQRFGGIARLYGRAGLERLRRSHVCVIGVGGVGSWTVEALARSAVGTITMIDLDDVCITNVNRQLPALDGTVGRPKVEVLAERVQRIHPGCRVEAVTDFFTPATADRLLESAYDYVIDATDRMTNKCIIIDSCRKRDISILTVGGAGGKRDGSGVRVADLGRSTQDDLLRMVRRKLRKDFGYPYGENAHFGVMCAYSTERPVFPWADGSCQTEAEPGSGLTLDCASGFGTATFVTGAFGFAAAGEAVRKIALGS